MESTDYEIGTRVRKVHDFNTVSWEQGRIRSPVDSVRRIVDQWDNRRHARRRSSQICMDVARFRPIVIHDELMSSAINEVDHITCLYSDLLRDYLVLVAGSRRTTGEPIERWICLPRAKAHGGIGRATIISYRQESCEPEEQQNYKANRRQSRVSHLVPSSGDLGVDHRGRSR
jgi:hypothetical protein